MEAFSHCAKTLGFRNPHIFGREILEEYLACCLHPDERRRLGLRPEWQKTEPTLLSEAIVNFQRPK